MSVLIKLRDYRNLSAAEKPGAGVYSEISEKSAGVHGV